MIGYAQYHNVLVPQLPDGTPARQVNPCPTACIPSGNGDARTLHAEIDAGATYPDLVRSWSRSFDSDDPTEIIITDVMVLREPLAVGFHVHSRFPWEKLPKDGRRAGTKPS